MAEDIICFKCGHAIPSIKVIWTRDGKAICPADAKKLGMKVRRVNQLQEVTRMKSREEIDVERERLREAIADGEAGGMTTEETDEVEAGIDTLGWVLGEHETLDLPRSA